MIYNEKKGTVRSAILIAFLSLMGIMVFSSTIGVADVSFTTAARVILSKIPLIGDYIPTKDIKLSHMMIILNLRLPRIIISALVGAGLSIVGTALQGMLKNPMADPYVLGISSGASLGATIAIVAGLEYTLFGVGFKTLFAFIGSMITIICVYSLAKVGNRIPSVTLLLSGIAFSFLLSSMVSIMMIFNRNQVEKIVFWIMGSVSAASWNQIAVILPFIVIGIVVIMSFARDLNVMAMGEEDASSMGIEVEKVKKLIIIMSSILVAACVSVSGVIGFVGLIIPHTVRLLTGADHRVVLPFSIIGGAGFMVICDVIARIAIPPTEIPVGAITSILGAPYFMYLLYRNKKKVF